jgi:hypothetical protein
MLLITRELIGGREMDRVVVEATGGNAAIKRRKWATVAVVLFDSAKIADN